MDDSVASFFSRRRTTAGPAVTAAAAIATAMATVVATATTPIENCSPHNHREITKRSRSDHKLIVRMEIEKKIQR